MKRIIVMMAMVALMIFGNAPEMLAQGRGKFNRMQSAEHGEHDRNRGERLVRHLDLSEAQQASIEKLRLDMQKQLLPMRNVMGEKKARLQTLQTAENPDKNEIEQLIREMGELRTEMKLVKNDHRMKVRAELTEEQRIKMDAMKGQHGHKHGKGGRW